MKLPHFAHESCLPAQLEICEFLIFLGANEVEFEIDETYNCRVHWRYNGHALSETRSANSYIQAWFKFKVWKTAGHERAEMSHPDEVALAIINYWYLMKDELLASTARKLFEFEKNSKSSESMTADLFKRLTISRVDKL